MYQGMLYGPLFSSCTITHSFLTSILVGLIYNTHSGWLRARKFK